MMQVEIADMSIGTVRGTLRFLPAVSAILTGAHVCILNIVDRDTGRRSLVFLLATDVHQCAGNEQEDPQEQVDDPPPGADENPPEAAVALFLVLGFRGRDRAPIFLKGLNADVGASALWTSHNGVTSRSFF